MCFSGEDTEEEAAKETQAVSAFQSLEQKIANCYDADLLLDTMEIFRQSKPFPSGRRVTVLQHQSCFPSQRYKEKQRHLSLSGLPSTLTRQAPHTHRFLSQLLNCSQKKV